jgi:deazaflavin-dependent oxidoreductase (nitroreductase family)
MSGFNDMVIDEFRANGGVVARFGSSLVLLHTVGAKSGEPRIHPLMALPQSDGSWLIAASAAGATSSPAWYFNLIATPDAAIETGSETVEVVASELADPEYDDAWAQFLARGPAFADYQVKAGERRIPVIRLARA